MEGPKKIKTKNKEIGSIFSVLRLKLQSSVDDTLKGRVIHYYIKTNIYVDYLTCTGSNLLI